MMKTWIGVCVSAVVVSAASAQQSAGEVLQRAIEAARGVQSLEMTASVKGEGGFAGLLPAGDATVRMVRAREEGEVLFDAQVAGTIKSKADGEGDPLEVLTHRTDERTVSVDHATKRVREQSGRLALTAVESMDLYVTPWEFATPTPYEREMNADAVEYVGEDTIGGETVDVVRFEYPKAAENRRGPRTPLDSFSNATWSFARSDGLPRRVVRNAGGAGLSFALIVEFDDVKTNTGLTADQLAIEVPEGYTLQSLVASNRPVTGPGDRSRLTRRDRPGRTPTESAPDATPAAVTPAAPSAPSAPAFPDAPAFEMVTASGEKINKETLAGKVSVFYFWGTWCVPCRAFSPLISDLVDTFEGEPVLVYAPAVRERTADAPAAFLEEKGYKHTLLLGSPDSGRVGADAAARAFKVRIYPSIAVIGAAGELVAFERAGAGRSPGEIVKSIEDSVRSYLINHADKLDG